MGVGVRAQKNKMGKQRKKENENPNLTDDNTERWIDASIYSGDFSCQW